MTDPKAGERADGMKWLTDILKKMDRTKWLILGLGGILMLVIALPAASGSNEKDPVFEQTQNGEQQNENLIRTYKKQLADELERHAMGL